jgi:hypothetical protein
MEMEKYIARVPVRNGYRFFLILAENEALARDRAFTAAVVPYSQSISIMQIPTKEEFKTHGSVIEITGRLGFLQP